VTVAPEVADYVLAIVAATRSTPMFSLGASPRGAIALLGGARAGAAPRRGHVEPDEREGALHSRAGAPESSGGRGRGGELERLAAERVVRDLVEQVPVPE